MLILLSCFALLKCQVKFLKDSEADHSAAVESTAPSPAPAPAAAAPSPAPSTSSLSSEPPIQPSALAPELPGWDFKASH